MSNPNKDEIENLNILKEIKRIFGSIVRNFTMSVIDYSRVLKIGICVGQVKISCNE